MVACGCPDIERVVKLSDYSDYAAIGGGPAVKQAVDRFYERVFADEQLVPYFTGVDETQLKKHQAALVAQVLGGPAQYEGRELAHAHTHLGVTGPHFDRVVGHFAATLRELGVGEDIVGRAGAALVGTKDDIVQARAGSSAGVS